MSENVIYNLSSRAIPADAKVSILGEQKPGEVLVIESFSGATGTANWRSAAHAEARLAQHKSVPVAAPAKPRAPYS